ncbi:MAG: flagellar hook capping FlgD N-terminal domain-containing protein [Rhodocyclaceae bacterium]
MTIEAIGGVTSGSASTTTSTQSVVGQEDLIKIMLAELRYQDPLKPLDNKEFIAQLAQFTTLEQTKQLNDRIDTLLSVQASTQSIGLLGKTVEVTTESGDTQVGEVTSIQFSDGQPRLTIKAKDGSLFNNIGLASVVLVS